MSVLHRMRGIHRLFRIPRNMNPESGAFLASADTDGAAGLAAPKDAPPEPPGRSVTVRPARYTAGDTGFRLATSLPAGDRHRRHRPLRSCHRRWRAGTMHDGLKDTLAAFHAESGRGVRQEPSATFTPLALARIFASRRQGGSSRAASDGRADVGAGFRNGIRLAGRETGAMFLMHGALLKQAVTRIMTGLSRCLCRERSGRSRERVSKKSGSKWMARRSA